MKPIEYVENVEKINKELARLNGLKKAYDSAAQKEQLLNVELGMLKEELAKIAGFEANSKNVKFNINFHSYVNVVNKNDLNKLFNYSVDLAYNLKIFVIDVNGFVSSCSVTNRYNKKTLLADGTRLIDHLEINSVENKYGALHLPADKLSKLIVNIDPVLNVELFQNNTFRKAVFNCIKRQAKEATVQHSYQQRRKPLGRKIAPHVRYNPDTLNNKNDGPELN